MAEQHGTPALAGARGSGNAHGDVQSGTYPEAQVGTRHELIAAFIGAYRISGGEPSAMMAAVLSAFPGAAAADYAAGLILANRAERAGGSHA